MEHTRFEIKGHSTLDLGNWLQGNFPFLEDVIVMFTPEKLGMLEERADEIYDACMKVKSRFDGSSSAYIEYYKQDWKMIQDAYENKDYRQLAVALNRLLTSIEWQ